MSFWLIVAEFRLLAIAVVDVVSETEPINWFLQRKAWVFIRYEQERVSINSVPVLSYP